MRWMTRWVAGRGGPSETQAVNLFTKLVNMTSQEPRWTAGESYGRFQRETADPLLHSTPEVR